MKTLVLLGFIIFSAYIVYQQDRAHQLGLDQEEEKILKDLSKESLTPAIKKVMTYQARQPASVENHNNMYNSLENNLPGDAKFHAITLELLQSLSSMNVSELDVSNPKVTKAIEAFNADPKLAKETMLILLDHAISTQDDLLVAHMLAVTDFVDLDRKEIASMSEEILTTDIIDGRTESIPDNQLHKMREASRVFIHSTTNESDVIASVRTIFMTQTNPFLRREILLQLGTRYPLRARLLELEFFPIEDSQ